jgi:outer membrane protein assembly factor BamA
MKMKKILPFILGFARIIPVLQAQDNSEGSNIPIIGESSDVYVIRGIDFNITGRTLPYYLLLNGEFKEGERIQGNENFEKYLARRIQLLNNQRVLDDTATQIEYFLGEPEEDGAIPVRLLVHVRDTMNFIILPYPKYDSNDGFSLTLKARDYNFLGTMSPLRIDLGYKLDNDSRNSFNFMIDSDIPFQAFGLDWNINFDHYFELTIDEPLYYQNVTGLSVQVPWRNTTFTFGFNHYLTFNEASSEEPGSYYDPYGSTALSASWGIPLGIEVGDFGQLSYTPWLSGRISYPYGQMNDGRKPSISWGHSLGFGRVDWIGNQRKGFSASIGNSFSWYFDRSDDAPLAIGFDVGASFYWPFNSIIGVQSRLKYRQSWHWSELNEVWYMAGGSGDVLRGVLNNDIQRHYMLSLNIDFPVRVLRFWPSEWFDNDSLRYFNFEMFVSPFLDMAMAKGSFDGSEITFSFGDMIKTTGIEVIVYPGIMRSLQIRGSIGYDIDKIRNNGLPLKWGFFPEWNEIYIGVDLYY